MAGVAIVQTALRMDAKQFTKTIDNAKASVVKLASDSRGIAAGIGGALLSASVGLGAIAVGLKNAADEADAVGDSLAQAFKGAELEAVTKKVLELGAQGVYTEKVFEGVAKAVSKNGKNAESSLIRLADVASKTGAPLDALGEAYGRLGKDDKATKQILRLTGLNPGDLVEYGAVLDQTTGKLSITGDNADKLVDAFNALADSNRFAGAAMMATDGASQLTAELKLLKAEVGAGLVSAWEDAGAAILPAVQYLRGFSDETKKLVGVSVLVGSVATGLGAMGIAGTLAVNSFAGAVVAAGGLAGFFAPVLGILTTMATTALPAVTVGLTALTTIFNPLSLAVLAIAAATKIYIDTLASAAAEAENLFQIEEKRAAAARTAEQFIGKSAQELSKAGKTAKDVAAVADGLSERASAALENKNEALYKKIFDQVAELREVQRELSVLEADDRETKAIQADVKTALGPAPDAAAQAAQARADDDARAKREAAEDAAAAERTKKEKAAHAQRVKDKQAALDAGAKIHVKVDYQIAQSSSALTKQLKSEQDKRLKDQVDAANAAFVAAKQQADDLASAQEKNRNLRQGALDGKISDLQTDTEQNGTDNTGKIKAAFTERARLEQEQIRLDAQRERDATTSVEARKQIEENAQLEIQASYRQTNDEFKRALKDQQDALATARADAAKKSTLGQVMSLQDALSSTSLNYGVGRNRDRNTSALANLPAPNLQSLPSGDSSRAAAGMVDAAQTILAAAKIFQDTRIQVDVKADRSTAAGSREATSGDGRQSSLGITGRSIRRRN